MMIISNFFLLLTIIPLVITVATVAVYFQLRNLFPREISSYFFIVERILRHGIYNIMIS